ncbi:MAG: acetyl-CoA carboxylase biotin carboxyl carrier protein subunit [Odoribacteraceae bacterium]|jgi:biotin carboxyl carrier protein|nr:acetyl-CoA carboxylase biotin carboxyl carrier protein subunit [Odoribacteraceae bacterium]
MDDAKYDKLEIDGVYYKTTFPEKFTNRKQWTPPEPGAVRTYIPGTIVEMHAREGDQVKSGDLLCILDAMKMRNRVVAPVNGTIARVLVKKGDKLPKDTLMFEIK